MERSQPAAWTSNRSLLVASRVTAFSRRPTNPTRPYQEVRTWKVALFSVTGVANPALHLRILLLGAGDIELNLGPTCSGCYELIRCDNTHPSSARPSSGTSTETTVASPHHKGVYKALSASSVTGVLLQYPIRRPSPVTAYCHADVYSVTQRIHTVSVPLSINSVPTTHIGSAPAYPAVWPTLPGCAPNALYQLPSSLPNP